MKPSPPDLSTRVFLRIPEAAACCGISESKLRRLIPEMNGCVVRTGGTTLIVVEGLQAWAKRKAAEADHATNAEVDALLHGPE